MSATILNNYTYESKSPYLDALDFFSAPLRKALGGRQINIWTKKSEEELPSLTKPRLIYCLVILLPITLVAAMALCLKKMAWTKESQRLKLIDAKISDFTRANLTGLYLGKYVRDYPEIFQRSDVREQVLTYLRSHGRIEEKDIQPLINLFPKNERIQLLVFLAKEETSPDSFVDKHFRFETYDEKIHFYDLFLNELRKLPLKEVHLVIEFLLLRLHDQKPIDYKGKLSDVVRQLKQIQELTSFVNIHFNQKKELILSQFASLINLEFEPEVEKILRPFLDELTERYENIDGLLAREQIMLNLKAQINMLTVDYPNLSIFDSIVLYKAARLMSTIHDILSDLLQVGRTWR